MRTDVESVAKLFLVFLVGHSSRGRAEGTPTHYFLLPFFR